MNSPYASDEYIDNPQLNGYSTGKVVIYAAFDGSCSEAAHKVLRNLVSKHSIGFFDVRADGKEYRS